ncbi:hypothetical protein SK128_017238, partial [Halocaridina rubra]
VFLPLLQQLDSTAIESTFKFKHGEERQHSQMSGHEKIGYGLLPVYTGTHPGPAKILK